MSKIVSALYNSSCPDSNVSHQWIIIINDVNKHSINSSAYASLIDEVKQTRSSGCIKEFLKTHISWNVRFYDLKRSNIFPGNITALSNDRLHELYQNDSYPFFSEEFCSSYNVTTPKDDFAYFAPTFEIFGIISLFGNAITFLSELRSLIKQKNAIAKERKLYSILVLNLCLVYMLMAIYLIAFPILKISNSTSTTCKILGVISTLSAQVSVSVLVIITAFRFYGIIFPFKLIRIKVAVSCLISIWLIWLIIVSLPLFNETIFAHQFTQEVLVNKSKILHLELISEKIQNLARELPSLQYEPFGQVINILSNITSNEVAMQILESFNLVDFDDENVSIVEYYNVKHRCSIPLFLTYKNATTFFTLFLFTFNLTGFLFILVGHLIMLKNISALRIQNMKYLFFCQCFKPSVKTIEQITKERKTENRKVYIRIFAVIITDLICGVTVCLISFLYFFKIIGPFPLGKEPITRIASILFPLGSVINPYIYCFHLWKKHFKRFKKRFLRFS